MKAARVIEKNNVLIAVALIVLIIAATVIVRGGGYQPSVITQEVKESTKEETSLSPSSAPQPIPSTGELLARAKRAMETDYQPNKDPEKTKSWGHITEAEDALGAIKTYDNEQQKAETEKLRKELVRRQKEIEKVAEAFTRKAMILQRENLRDNLDRIFLKQGWDVRLAIEGKKKDILVLYYALWNRPLVYKITNEGSMAEGSFLSNLKKAGFQKVVFDDRYDFRTSYDLSDNKIEASR